MPGSNNQGFVIGTSPNRTVQRAKNRVQKYATIQPDSRFRFTQDLQSATVFPTMAALLQAYGSRCQELNGDPTSDLIVFQVQSSGVTIVGTLA